jgi:hypothetical protein
MINILYIGPYKNTNILGHASRDIIHELSHTNNVCIRPLYIDNYFDNNIQDIIIQNLTKKKLEGYYDIIIQHCPINLIAETFGLCEKSVVIPLFEKIVGSDLYIKKLENIDHILVDSEDYAEFLSENYSIKATAFSYSKLYNVDASMSLPIYNNTIKFYSIYDDYDSVIFNKTIEAFYKAFGDNDDISYTYLINNKDRNTTSKITQEFEALKKDLGIKTNLFNVQVIMRELNLSELCSIHKYGNIFIDIEQNNFTSKIHRYIAQSYNKMIITDQLLINDMQVDTNNRSQVFLSVGTQNLIEAMNNILGRHDNIIHNFANHPTITTLLCP